MEALRGLSHYMAIRFIAQRDIFNHDRPIQMDRAVFAVLKRSGDLHIFEKVPDCVRNLPVTGLVRVAVAVRNGG